MATVLVGEVRRNSPWLITIGTPVIGNDDLVLHKVLHGERTTVIDAVGATWRTGDIYETSVLLTTYGMCFIALLALLRIAERRTTASALPAEVNIIQPGEPNPVRLPA